MATPPTMHSHPTPGAARLPIVVPVAMVSFFYAAILDYALPLYFGALNAAAEARGRSFPVDSWSHLIKYQVTIWILGPILAGLLARRYGERKVWCAALLGQAAVPIVLTVNPLPGVIPWLALWQGLTGALMWIAGISLVQMVSPEKKGMANGLMMTSVGAGSVCGPVVGRLLLYRRELLALIGAGDWSAAGSRLLTLQSMKMTPQVADFLLIFVILLASTVICGVLVGIGGQHPGRFEHDPAPDWQRTLSDVGRLVRIPRLWALIIALCLLGGPVFQSSNQFLPYRAEDLGLKSGSQDEGWVWLQLLKTAMWLPGGAAVGCLAGRRAPGIVAAAMVGSFGLAALGIGLSHAAWQLFASVALFEFVRQFMRWSNAGYLSEHLPGDLRATAIGFAITFAGLGSTIYGWAADFAWNPSVDSSRAFVAAAMLGGAASLGLFLFDRLHPIREAEPGVASTFEPAAVPPFSGEPLP